MVDLGELRGLLQSGIRLSKQGSYQRRAPAPEAVPLLVEARDGLRRLVRMSPNDADAWRLLSIAEECLLDYSSAVRSLEMALILSSRRDRRDLRRLALLRHAAGEWKDLLLSPAQLADLGDFLQARLGGSTGERCFRFTLEWLAQQEGVAESAAVITALEGRGAFSDFEVLHNIVKG